MINLAFNSVIKRFLQIRNRRIQRFIQYPYQSQRETLFRLLNKTQATYYGSKHHFSAIRKEKQFSKQVPLIEYDDIKHHIDHMMRGGEDILWPGQVKWFAKSSGTTSDKSKFIPIPKDNLQNCHIRSSWDAVTLLYKNKPEARIFADKNLVMGGSLNYFKSFPETRFGDVSAIMIHNMPLVGRPFYTPDFETALLADWETKIERMANLCSREEVAVFGGVPSWTLILFRRILEITGKENMLQIWPGIQAYFHGGVGFDPYREQFKLLFPGEQLSYMEIYNASEGYFAIQDQLDSDGMLLLLDNGIYYEFIPLEELDSENPISLTLPEVELNKVYALVISSNAGLWRYMPGDTIQFVNLNPFRIKVVGRTKQFINVFGEEVMISNTDKALATTCLKHSAIVSEYTVAPIYLNGKEKGGHQWLIEFEKSPADIIKFQQDLDKNLQAVNSDYEAKRFKDLALACLRIVDLPTGSFLRWMKKRNKMGGQHKIPRLSNNRRYVNEILDMIKESSSYD
jgi:hypothetical protein